MPRTSADDLRAGLSKLIAGGSDEPASMVNDPFAERNEWEDSQRRQKGGSRSADDGGAGIYGNREKPRSRRAQQAAAKAQRSAASDESKSPAGGAAAKSPGPKDSTAASSAPSVAPAARAVLPVDAAWWDALPAPPAGSQPLSAGAASVANLSLVRAQAAEAYEAELGAFAIAQRKKHGADQRIVQRLSAAGTVKDRIAALTLQTHESAFHCLPHLRQLVSLAEKAHKAVRMSAAEALTELFTQRLLPTRALVALERQPLPPGLVEQLRQHASSIPHPRKQQQQQQQHKPASAAELPPESLVCLLRAHFEAELKDCYAKFVSVVEAGMHDSVPHVKQRMIGTLYALLSAKPELERRLLASLVNKLGDTDKKAASQIAHLLGQLTVHHPAMKGVILAEVQRFVLRPNVSESSQYYACVFMNQMILTRADPSLAHTLLLIFLALFSSRTAHGQPLGTRMLSMVLSGLHRAIPFCDDPATRDKTGDLLSSQLTSLFRCAHAASFGTAVQALMVLSHATSFNPDAADRFHRALYSALLHPELPNSGKQALFLNVVYKAMKADTHEGRLCAFGKRLLQACAHAPPSFICGVLLLLSEVTRRKPALKALLTAPPPSTAAAAPDGGVASAEGEGEGEEAAGEGGTGGGAKTLNGYDWTKRDPLHAGAEQSRLWELTRLLGHYHPSVVQFARSVSKAEPISYAGDPLRDFGLMPFLDKFVFKNPKSARRRAAGGSIMQPSGGVAASGDGGAPELAMSSRGAVANLLSKPVERVAAHERFFHTYFARKKEAEEKAHRGRPGQKPQAPSAAEDEEGGDDLGADGEAFAQRLAKSLMRDEGAFEEGDDDDDDDLDDDDDDDDVGEDEDEDEDEDDDDIDFDFGEEGEDDDEDDDGDGDLAFGEDMAAAEEEEESSSRKKKRKKAGGPTFADASEFAHILEAAADPDEGVNPRLAEWERGGRRKGGASHSKRSRKA